MKVIEHPIMVLTLILGVAIFPKATCVGQTSMERQNILAGGELQSALSVLGDIVVIPRGIEQIGGAGLGITFYVGWGSVFPRTYLQLSQIVNDFSGQLKWSIQSEFNNRGAFISALPLEQAKAAFAGQSVQHIALSDLHRDVQQFCAFVRQSIRTPSSLSTIDRKSKLDKTPFEDSEYRIFLVAAPEHFSGTPTSPFDRMLHFGITEEEWTILSTEHSETSKSSFARQQDLLSKLKQRYEVIRLSAQDVQTLIVEFDAFSPSLAEAKLQMPIQKIQRILREASKEQLGVVFQPNY